MKSNTYTLQKPDIEIPLDKQVSEIFQRSLSKLPVYKDLPRLASRITIEKFTPPPEPVTTTSSTLSPSSSSSLSSSPLDNTILKKRKSRALSLKLSKDFGDVIGKDNEDKLTVDEDQPTTTNTPTPQEVIDAKIWKTTKQIINTLAELYEDQETQIKIKSTFENSKQPSDYQLSLPTLFKNCMDENTSKVIKILKLVHQNIIYIGCYELKIKVPYLMTNLTKDVRGPEGWTINIFKGKDTTTVTHTKREESLDKRFYFEWQLHMTLSKDLSEISYASLKITDLVFAPNVDQHFKELVSRNLFNGNLFVM